MNKQEGKNERCLSDGNGFMYSGIRGLFVPSTLAITFLMAKKQKEE